MWKSASAKKNNQLGKCQEKNREKHFEHCRHIPIPILINTGTHSSEDWWTTKSWASRGRPWSGNTNGHMRGAVARFIKWIDPCIQERVDGSTMTTRTPGHCKIWASCRRATACERPCRPALTWSVGQSPTSNNFIINNPFVTRLRLYHYTTQSWGSTQRMRLPAMAQSTYVLVKHHMDRSKMLMAIHTCETTHGTCCISSMYTDIHTRSISRFWEGLCALYVLWIRYLFTSLSDKWFNIWHITIRI
jgi:hypothetical protein